MSNDFPLTVIPEPEMSVALDGAIRDLLCLCFPADVEAFSASRAWHESAPSFSVVLPDGEAVVGHVAMVLREIRCGETHLVVAGVQSLCVHPTRRGTGLAQALMAAALQETSRLGVRFGLLFCVPELERFYRSLNWMASDARVTMRDEGGRMVPIPDKNIGMQIELSSEPFPAGPIDLNGRDW